MLHLVEVNYYFTIGDNFSYLTTTTDSSHNPENLVVIVSPKSASLMNNINKQTYPSLNDSRKQTINRKESNDELLRIITGVSPRRQMTSQLRTGLIRHIQVVPKQTQ